jgi:hypothetical protein
LTTGPFISLLARCLSLYNFQKVFEFLCGYGAPLAFCIYPVCLPIQLGPLNPRCRASLQRLNTLDKFLILWNPMLHCLASKCLPFGLIPNMEPLILVASVLIISYHMWTSDRLCGQWPDFLAAYPEALLSIPSPTRFSEK